MAPKTENLETTRIRPVLARRTVRADGSSHCALRVYCDKQNHSVPVEACGRCRDCVAVESGPDGAPRAVRCPPGSTDTAGGALARGVIVVEPEVSLARVVDLLAGAHAMAVAVSDRTGKIAGVIHESQLLPELLARGPALRHEGDARLASARLCLERADQAMSAVSAVEVTTPLRTAVDVMAKNHGRFVVVVDPGGVPLGLLWDADGLHALFGKRDEH